jgi:glutaredoxin
MSTTITNLEIENSTPSNSLTTDLTIKKSTTLSMPLTIYTTPGCSACADVKKLCIRKGIKFEAFDRKDHAEYVNKNTGNCKFVPNVFNSNEEYIGGNDDLIKLTKNMKDIQI